MKRKDTEPATRFALALKLGPLALLRLRAEVLLNLPHEFTLQERERLERIAAAPITEDHSWLGEYDYLFEEDQ